MYANITNPANFQLQDFAQFGFRVITTDFIPVPGEQYRTLYVLQDAVVTATTQKGDDITSKAILAGTLLHGLFNSVSITSGRVLAYAAGRVTADEIIALYESYVSALGGTLENTQCAIDTLNDTGVDFFADASLVMIPEGYGTGVVYGQRPLTSDSQLTFTRASTATRVGPDGAIAVVGSNVPRIDYTGGGCGKLLLEPQRTNLALYSEQFDNAAWTKTNTTITANATTSPDGYANADTILSTAASPQLLSPVITFGAATNVSVFVKYVSQQFVQLFGGGAFGDFANFDIQNATLGTSGASTANAKIENYGNGWLRISATFSGFAGGTTARLGFTSASNAGWNILDTAFNKSVLAYGFQAELGAYATSYIPTTAAAVTRLEDACSKTGISSLIGQTEGTIFLDFVFKTGVNNTAGQIAISDPTSPHDRVLIWNDFTFNTLAANLQVNGSSIFNTSLGTFVDCQRYKIALAYKSGSSAAYVNGTQVFTNSSTFTFSSTITDFILGAYEIASMPAHQLTSQALLFKTRLTNEQLQTLTSL
jgi:hypothetical protein